MISLDDKEILKSVIKECGAMQLTVAVEELAELQKEICKSIRGDCNKEHVAEEIADVEIMIEQVKMIYGIDEAVEMYHEHKMQRLKYRLENKSL